MRCPLLMFQGSTGAGKSEALAYLHGFHSDRVGVVRKYTTRPRRSTDENWEFTYCTEIPARVSDYAFGSVGSRYAVDIDSVLEVVRSSRIASISCTDAGVARRLKGELDAALVFVYRPMTHAELDALLEARATTGNEERRHRHDELASTLSTYARNFSLIDHVIINGGSLEAFHMQIDALVAYYS
jgi:guanylate kinase